MTNEFIQQNFVTPEIAKALKELGFNEPCLGYYTGKIMQFRIPGSEWTVKNEYFQSSATAPLWQQACVFVNQISKDDQIEPVYENLPALEPQIKYMIDKIKSQQSNH